jgi:hypothetical protein
MAGDGRRDCFTEPHLADDARSLFAVLPDGCDGFVPCAGRDLAEDISGARATRDELAAAARVNLCQVSRGGHSHIVQKAAEEHLFDAGWFEPELAGEEHAHVGDALGVAGAPSFRKIESPAQCGKDRAAAKTRNARETGIVVKRRIEEISPNRLDLRL